MDGDGTSPPSAASGLGLPHRLGRSMASNYVSTIVGSLASLAVTPLLIHHLGKDAYGVWALIVTTTAYLNLANLGFANVTTKLVAEDAGRDDAAVIRTFNSTFWSLCVFSLIALGIGLALATKAPVLLHLRGPMRGEAVDVFDLLTLATALALPVASISAVLAGYQRFDLISLNTAIASVATAATSVVVVLAGGRLVALGIGTTAVTVALLGVPLFMVHRLIPDLRLSPRLVERSNFRRITSLSSWYLVQNLAAVVGGDLDLFVVGTILGVRAVAVFAVAAQLGLVAARAVGVLQQAFYPHVSSTSRSEGPRRYVSCSAAELGLSWPSPCRSALSS